MISNKPIVTVYFSKNRPLQLDLTLSTNKLHSFDWKYQNECVIYTTTDDRFEKAYRQLAIEHPHVHFIRQRDFKSDLLHCLHNSDHVMFVVDDCIFTREYSAKGACRYLEIFPKSIGFSLRLGKNTRICYPLHSHNSIPRLAEFGGICLFNWITAGAGDFSYPLELSSSIYRTDDMFSILQRGVYDTPNSLEWLLSQSRGFFVNKAELMCYETSVAFCSPVNKIQTENFNRTGNNPNLSIMSLLEKYEQGIRIDPENFSGFVSNGCHQEVDLFKEDL